MLWEYYRSIVAPNPGWKEQALYGPYEWLELKDDFWVNRRWEVEATQFMRLRKGEFQCSGQCIKEFADLLANRGFFTDRVGSEDIKGLTLTYDDVLRVAPVTQSLKIFHTLSEKDTLVIYGYNDGIANFLFNYAEQFREILGTKENSMCEIQHIGWESLGKAHMQQKVVVAKESFSAKAQIRLWSNIIVI